MAVKAQVNPEGNHTAMRVRDLEAAGFGRIVIERDRGPQDQGRATGVQDDLEPLDEGPAGPTEGAEEPDSDVAQGPDTTT